MGIDQIVAEHQVMFRLEHCYRQEFGRLLQNIFWKKKTE